MEPHYKNQMKKSLMKLVIASGLVIISPQKRPAQQGLEPMNGWDVHKREEFTDMCVKGLREDSELSQAFSQDQIQESCRCITAYYEASYDYWTFSQMMSEAFNTNPNYKEEMFNITIQCARHGLGSSERI